MTKRDNVYNQEAPIFVTKAPIFVTKFILLSLTKAVLATAHKNAVFR